METGLALVKRKRGRPRKDEMLSPPRAAGLDDVPLYDPDQLIHPALPGRDLDTKPADEKPLSVEDARKLLATKAQELLDADANQLPRLTKDIQRLRVVLLLLQEAGGTESDPNIHKELSLLNKLITGKGLEGMEGDEEGERKERVAKAEELLQGRGVDVATAGRYMRVLQAIMGAGALHGTAGDDEPNPPATH